MPSDSNQPTKRLSELCDRWEQIASKSRSIQMDTRRNCIKDLRQVITQLELEMAEPDLEREQAIPACYVREVHDKNGFWRTAHIDISELQPASSRVVYIPCFYAAPQPAPPAVEPDFAECEARLAELDLKTNDAGLHFARKVFSDPLFLSALRKAFGGGE